MGCGGDKFTGEKPFEGVRFNQSRISRAERLFNYDVIDSHAVGCNSNKQNDPIDDALRGHHALASLPAGI